jgi:hypothetical protein
MKSDDNAKVLIWLNYDTDMVT